MSDANDLGNRIAEARERRGLTQKQLAELLGPGAAERTIQDWESGRRRPRPRTRLRIFEVLEIAGDESETRAEWPARVNDLLMVLGDLMASLPEPELLRWRQQFIATFVSRTGRPPGPRDWPTDVEVIVDIIGAALVTKD